jgi:type IV pilus assembly protein PilW
MATRNVRNLRYTTESPFLIGIVSSESQWDAEYGNGFTLFEFVVAMMMASLLTVAIGSLLFFSQKSVIQLNNQLMLRSNLFSTIHALRSDLQLAGFNFPVDKSVNLKNADSVVYVGPQRDLLAYVYRKGEKEYQHVVYRYQSISASRGVIKICEKSNRQPLTVEEAALSGPIGDCYSLFDPNHISVRNFDITYQPLVGRSATSGFITVSITAFLTHDASVSETASFQIVQRNWQS